MDAALDFMDLALDREKFLSPKSCSEADLFLESSAEKLARVIGLYKALPAEMTNVSGYGQNEFTALLWSGVYRANLDGIKLL